MDQVTAVGSDWKELIEQVRKIRGIIIGKSIQPANSDFGFVGQAYENLVYGEEGSESELADPEILGRIVALAQYEIAHPELFR